MNKLDRKYFFYQVALAAGLLTLVVLQFLLVRQAWEARNQEFDMQMTGRLEKIKEEAEQSYYCFELYTELDIAPRQGMVLLSGNELRDTVQAFHFTDTSAARIYPEYPWSDFIYDAPIHARIQLDFAFLGSNDYPLAAGDTGANWVDKAYRHTLRDQKSGFRIIDTLVFQHIVRQVLGTVLDSTMYHAQITRYADDSLIYRFGAPAQTNGAIYTARLYTEPPFQETYNLEISVYGTAWMALRQVGYLVVGLLLAVVAIVFLFMQFSRMLWRQARLAESKNQFVNNVTHEFKTPIANIRLAVDTLSRRLNGENVHHDILSVIEEENNRMNSNIDIILRTAAMSEGHIYYRKEKHPLDILVKEAAAGFVKQLSGRGMLHVNAASEATVIVDRQHFVNAIQNVLDNAVKYAGDKSPGIKVTTFSDGKNAIVSIEDSGIGMTPYEQSRIFEKFYRASNGNTHDIKGFGLGLYYTRQVIHDFGGSIEVKSQKGQGSIFTICLPADIKVPA